MKNINKITKNSPMSAGVDLLMGNPLGVIGGPSLKNSKKGSNGKEYGQGELKGKINEAYKGFEDIDYKSNLWGGAQNQFADAENKYSNLENKYEDLTVNQQQAQFQAQQGAQQRSDIMGNLKRCCRWKWCCRFSSSYGKSRAISNSTGLCFYRSTRICK
jgi:hypothetical protein